MSWIINISLATIRIFCERFFLLIIINKTFQKNVLFFFMIVLLWNIWKKAKIVYKFLPFIVMRTSIFPCWLWQLSYHHRRPSTRGMYFCYSLTNLIDFNSLFFFVMCVFIRIASRGPTNNSSWFPIINVSGWRLICYDVTPSGTYFPLQVRILSGSSCDMFFSFTTRFS